MIKTVSGNFCNRLSWGTGSSFGYCLTNAKAIYLINKLVGSGVNFFDTNGNYAKGKSQILLGKCLKEIKIKREDIIISSKIGSLPSKLPSFKAKKNYNAESQEFLVKKALLDFGTDYLDVLYLHGLPNKPLSELEIQKFLSFKKKGIVRYLGVAAHNQKDLEWVLKNFELFDTVMCHFNQLNYNFVEPYLKKLREKSIFIVGSSPFAGGLLSSKKRFKNIKNLNEDVFYTIKSLIPRQRKYKQAAKIILKANKKRIAPGTYPLEFSLKSDLLDTTIFGSLSIDSIIKSINLLSL